MKRILTFAVAVTFVGLPLSAALAQPQTQPQTQPDTQSQPGQQTPQSQPQQASTPSGSGLTIASDSLLGTKVRDAQGKDMGEVSKLMIDAKEGTVTSVIIRQGGTLGMGGKEVSVPWDALQVQRDQDQELVVTMQQEMLEQTQEAQQQRQQQRQQQQQDRQSPAASPPASGQEQQPKRQ